jgi:translation initiation factor IF-1
MEVLPKSIFRVELPNGHRILAFPSGKMRTSLVRIALGDRVTVAMSPFDFSKGRILAKQVIIYESPRIS